MGFAQFELADEDPRSVQVARDDRSGREAVARLATQELRIPAGADLHFRFLPRLNLEAHRRIGRSFSDSIDLIHSLIASMLKRQSLPTRNPGNWFLLSIR